MCLRETVLPQFFPASWLIDAPEIVFSDFPSRIRVGYVIREDSAYSYLLKEQFSLSGLTPETLHSCALDNLCKLPSGQITLANVSGGAEGFISSEDNFAAARLLLPAVRTEFASRLGDDFLASLPHRDDCCCWSQAQDLDRQTRHSAEALEDFESAEYNLTPDILIVNVTGFRLFREQDAEQFVGPELAVAARRSLQWLLAVIALTLPWSMVSTLFGILSHGTGLSWTYMYLSFAGVNSIIFYWICSRLKRPEKQDDLIGPRTSS